jgi:hypothetical protein
MGTPMVCPWPEKPAKSDGRRLPLAAGAAESAAGISAALSCI